MNREMVRPRVLTACLVAVVALMGSIVAAVADGEDPLKRAMDALRAGRPEEASALVDEATRQQPTNAHAWFVRGVLRERKRDHTNAIADFDRAAKLDPKSAIIFQHRGAEHFRIGNFEKSIADFDRFLELTPSQAPHHWQRGISLYYAGKFDEGRKQFESHQTVNPKDVENAVWHFLCVARSAGLEKARASLIPITGDSRVPMKEIHALFAGKGTADDVVAAAKNAGGEEPMFYAQLYLGLYYEAAGDPAKAREHITKAARDFKADHYMGDVARIHARRVEKSR